MTWLTTNLSIYNISLKESIAYRFSMLLSLITGPVDILIQYVIWQSVFAASGVEVLGGYTFNQILVYYAITLLTFYFIWDNEANELGQLVTEGNFTPYLTKPVAYVRMAFLNKVGHRSLAFMIELIPVIGILGLIFGFGIFGTNNLMYYVLSLFIAFVIYFELNMIVGMLSFWVVRPHGVLWIYNFLRGFLSGALILLTFFPHSFQAILSYLPFQFLNYVPAQIFLGNYSLGVLSMNPGTILVYGLVQMVILSAIMYIMWKSAVKRFCGVGT